jgi:arginine exporter protein ArgO
MSTRGFIDRFFDRLEKPQFVVGSIFWFLGIFVLVALGFLIYTKQFEKEQLYDIFKILIGIVIGGIAGRYGNKTQ